MPRQAPIDKLIEMLEGRLSEAESEALLHRAENLPAEERAEFDSWVRLMGALQEPLQSAPEHVLRRAYNLVTAAPSQPGVMRRIVAVLVRDTRLQPGLAGARASGAGGFHLEYATDERQVLLSIQPLSGCWQIGGEAVCAGNAVPSPREVSLSGPGGELRVPVDGFGQFFIEGLPPGSYALTLASSACVTELPPFELPTV